MKPGPKPKSTATLQMSGSYRPSKHAGRLDAVKPSGTPAKPSDLDEAAGDLWDRITAEHAARGTLGNIDGAALRALCEIWALYRAALKDARDKPSDKNARCAVLAYLAQVCRLGAEFGWTPASRASIKTGSGEITSPVSQFARKRA